MTTSSSKNSTQDKNHSCFSADQLKLRYIAALSLIAFLTIATQVIMQFLIADQAHDSRVINIAGRQRMLSQKITKTDFYIVSADRTEEANRYREELRSALDMWARSHRGLLNGDAALGLPGKNSAAILALFAQIEPHYKAIVKASEAILDVSTDRKVLTNPILLVREHEPAFLKGMNDIVFLYDNEAKEKVEFARWLEISLMCITLLVLLLEAKFIFAPATGRIRHDMRELAMREHELKHLFDVSPTAMLLVDNNNLSIIQANEKATHLIGYTNKDIINRSLRDHLDEEYDANKSFLEKILQGDALQEYEVVLLDARRAIYETLISVREVTFSGRTLFVLGITNITELKKAQQTLEHYATFDEMTGLVNRRTGLMMLEKAMARSKRDNSLLTACFADIDELKSANDIYGHSEGDWFICTVAQELSNNIRSSDTAIRLGGDEFLLILNDCPNEECSLLVRRIGDRLAKIKEKYNKPFDLKLSIGSVVYDSERHLSITDLVSEADQEMYRVKADKKTGQLNI